MELRLSAYGSHIVSFFYLVLSTELHQFEKVLALEHLCSPFIASVWHGTENVKGKMLQLKKG